MANFTRRFQRRQLEKQGLQYVVPGHDRKAIMIGMMANLMQQITDYLREIAPEHEELADLFERDGYANAAASCRQIGQEMKTNCDMLDACIQQARQVAAER